MLDRIVDVISAFFQSVIGGVNDGVFNLSDGLFWGV